MLKSSPFSLLLLLTKRIILGLLSLPLSLSLSSKQHAPAHYNIFFHSLAELSLHNRIKFTFKYGCFISLLYKYTLSAHIIYNVIVNVCMCVFLNGQALHILPALHACISTCSCAYTGNQHSFMYSERQNSLMI